MDKDDKDPFGVKWRPVSAAVAMATGKLWRVDIESEREAGCGIRCDKSHVGVKLEHSEISTVDER